MGHGRKRVLVVDDEAGLRSLICTAIDAFLVETGIHIEEEQTAHDAYVRVVQGANDRWFIVTDYKMPPVNGHPIRDGMDLIRRVRGHTPDVQAHIVFMTGTSIAEEDVHALGADRFLEKPYIFSAIIEDLVQFLASE